RPAGCAVLQAIPWPPTSTAGAPWGGVRIVPRQCLRPPERRRAATGRRERNSPREATASRPYTPPARDPPPCARPADPCNSASPPRPQPPTTNYLFRPTPAPPATPARRRRSRNGPVGARPPAPATA